MDVARGEIQIGLNDSAAVAGLRRTEAQFEAAMKRIDRQEAEVDINVNLRELKADLKKAEAEVRKFNAKERDLKSQIAKATEQEVGALRQAQQQNKTLLGQARAQANVLRQRATLTSQHIRQLKDEGKQIDLNTRRQQASLKFQEQRAKFAHQSATETEREALAAQKLLKRYTQLQREQRKLAGQRTPLAKGPRQELQIDRSRVKAEMALVRKELQIMAKSQPIKVPVEVDHRTLRAAGDRIVDTFKRIGDKAAGLGSTAVRIGPFTTSLKTASIAAVALGGAIVDLTASATALVGVMGTGLAGAASLGGAALAGFGLSLGGVALLMPKLLNDFKNLNTLQDAYHKQVLKTGKNSEKAKEKLAEFKNALGEVPPTTLRVFETLDKLNKKWDDVAKAARPDFFRGFDSALQTVNHNFDFFRKNSLTAFHEVTLGFRRWMRGLRTDEAGDIFSTLGGNANKSIRPLMAGLGSLATAFGRVAASASRFLGPAARGFAEWASGVARGTEDANRLDRSVGRLIDHAKSVGQLFMAAGRLIGTVLNGGADSGQRLSDTLTHIFNRWNAFLKSDEGQRKMLDFFARAEKGTKAIVGALAPLVSIFVRMAVDLSPVLTSFFKVLGFVGKITHGLIEMTGSAKALGAVFATMFLAKRAAGFLTFLKAANTLLGTMATRAGIVAAVPAAGGGAAAAGAAGTAAAGAGAGTAAATGGAAAGSKFASAFKLAVGKAGLLGVGVTAAMLVSKGMATAQAREGFKNIARGWGQDITSTMTGGIVSSASEVSRKAGTAVVSALQANPNLDIGKAILKKSDAGFLGWKEAVKSRFGIDLTGMIKGGDLTKTQREMAEGIKRALQAADRLVKRHKLPIIRSEVKVNANPRDFETLERNWNKLKNGFGGTLKNMEGMSDQSLRAIAKTFKAGSDSAKSAVQQNMRRTADAIVARMKTGVASASDGMAAIRRTFRTNSAAAKETTDKNFGAAKDAIQSAVRSGVISTRRGLDEIRKLYSAQLQMYGFTAKQARNESKKGTRYEGGPEEGTRGPGHARGGIIHAAQGALTTIGQKGQTGRDNVPANLNGQPAVIARGEQVAVFNKHQQKAMDRSIPGGLEGFFGSNSRPHYMNVGGMIGAMNRMDKAQLPYLLGGGHSTPAPFGPAMDCSSSVSYALQQGGAKVPTSDSGGMMGWGKPGKGSTTIYANPGHVLMSVNGRFWGTSGQNKGGGPGWINNPGQGYLSKFTVRNMDAMIPGGAGSGEMGAIPVPKIGADIGGALKDVVTSALTNVTGVANKNIEAIAATTVGGGNVGDLTAGPNGKKIFDFFMRSGFSKNQAAAWVGNFVQESGLNPAAQQPNGPGRGLAQWGGGRFSALQAFAKSKGNPWTDLLTQLQFVMHELTGSESAAYSAIKKATSLEAAVNAIGGRYERFGISGDRTGPARQALQAYGASGGIFDSVRSVGRVAAARGGKFNRPTLLAGDEDRSEFVIATNPAYRKSNLGHLQSAASALGVDVAAKGKGRDKKKKRAKGLSEKGQKKARAQARKRVPPPKKRTNYKQDEDAFVKVEKAKAAEDDQNRRISIAESRMKEPETFLDPAGEDQFGNPIFTLNQGRVDNWIKQLDGMKNMYDQLQAKIEAVRAAISEALVAVRAAINNAQRNIKKIDHEIQRERRIRSRKGTSKAAKEASLERLNVYQRVKKGEIAAQEAAEEDKGTLVDDRKDAGFRLQEAKIAGNEYKSDRDATAGTAAKEYDESVPEPPEPEAVTPEDVVSPTDAALAAADAQLAYAQFTPGLDDDKAAYEAIIRANAAKLSEAEAMLYDTDPGNDIEAYGSISSALGGIKSAQEAIGGLATSPEQMALQQQSLSGARTELMNQFGSNFSMAAGLGAPTRFGVGGFGTNSVFSGGGGAAGGAGGTVVNVVNNFATAPTDPHTWSRGISWELQAATS